MAGGQRVITLVGFSESAIAATRPALEQLGHLVNYHPTSEQAVASLQLSRCDLMILSGALAPADRNQLAETVGRSHPQVNLLLLDQNVADEQTLTAVVMERLEARIGVFEAVESMLASQPSPANTLLLIDDDSSHLLLRKFILETEGYTVLTARSGVEGVQLFRQNKVNVVVLDYHMPDLDGGIVAERLKQVDSSVPIIMFSAQALIPQVALRHVDSIVRKGEAPSLLLQKIKSVLNKSSDQL